MDTHTHTHAKIINLTYREHFVFSGRIVRLERVKSAGTRQGGDDGTAKKEGDER